MKSNYNMRHTFLLLVAFIITSPLLAQSKKALLVQVDALKKEVEELKSANELLSHPKPIELTDTLQKASYGLGTLFAANIKTQGADSMDVEALTSGIKDVFLNKPLQMQQEEAMPIVQAFMQAAMDKQRTILIDQNAAFLGANKDKEGVKTTESGLQYKVITSGTGKSPLPTDKVTVHYIGSLIDGTEFDNSVERNEPVTLQVDGVIPGWTEALQLMHEGDKWMLYIPFPLGYGERGAGEQIPPYSTLIFEVQLLKVN